jgi:tRNA U34 5-carboxymethylaminomethyl modifying GTPase MnmE/TrmE
LCSDTAGLRESADPIEQEGVKRALKKYIPQNLIAKICMIMRPPFVIPVELNQQI